MNIDIPEPVRAWAWHTTRALLAVTVWAFAGSLLLAFIWAAAWAINGRGSPLLPAAIVVGGGLLWGTVSWLKAGKVRP